MEVPEIKLMKFTKQVAIIKPLVDYCNKTSGRPIFISISPWERMKVNTRIKSKKINVKMEYGMLPQRCQLEWIQRYFKRVYLSCAPNAEYIGVVEHNKRGNVHVHIILWDKDINTDYDMDILRNYVNHNLETIIACGKRKTKYMNNIVYCDHPRS